ncbi:MAG: hypothetical protein HYV34_00225 [Candidatus Kerfeldbacteria bacterium]|nr:hypothetical protein [Candidatus Kerfeldbacteria bacterium]
MVKRISLLIRPRLRKMIETGDEGFRARGTLLQAYNLVHEILDADFAGGLEKPHPDLDKILASGYAEFNELHSALTRASRMQCVLELGSWNDVDFTLALFEKGGKKPVYSMHLSIGLVDGKVCNIYMAM